MKPVLVESPKQKQRQHTQNKPDDFLRAKSFTKPEVPNRHQKNDHGN